jgi:hypothetical protein
MARRLVWKRGGSTMCLEQDLRRNYVSHARAGTTERFYEHLWENICNGGLKPGEFSIRRLAENFIPGGRELVQSWNPQHGGGGIDLMEAGNAVDTRAFSNIALQIVYSTFMQAFMDEQFVFSGIVRNVPTPFNGETIPGIGRMGDVSEIIAEGAPYPRAGLNEDWIQTPQTQKRGIMIDLTQEAVFFDRTHLLVDRAADIGQWLGYAKEIRLINAFLDENATAHRYNWKGTIYATYQSASPWVNLVATNGLVDWKQVDQAEQALAAIRDPNTNAPTMSMPQHMVVGRANLYAAKRIVSATEIEVESPGYATAGAPTRTKAANPIQNYTIVSSQLLQMKMASSTNWYLGDIAKQMQYMENFAPTVKQAPPDSSQSWERDIAMSWKAMERGAAVVTEPRVTVKNTP